MASIAEDEVASLRMHPQSLHFPSPDTKMSQRRAFPYKKTIPSKERAEGKVRAKCRGQRDLRQSTTGETGHVAFLPVILQSRGR